MPLALSHPLAVSAAAWTMIMFVVIGVSVWLVLSVAEPRASLPFPTAIAVATLALAALGTMIYPMDVLSLSLEDPARTAPLAVFVDVLYAVLASGAAALFLCVPAMYVFYRQVEADEEDETEFDKLDRLRSRRRGGGGGGGRSSACCSCGRRQLHVLGMVAGSSAVLVAVAGAGAALYGGGAFDRALSEESPAWMRRLMRGHTWWSLSLAFLLGVSSLASALCFLAYTALGLAVLPVSDLIHAGVRLLCQPDLARSLNALDGDGGGGGGGGLEGGAGSNHYHGVDAGAGGAGGHGLIGYGARGILALQAEVNREVAQAREERRAILSRYRLTGQRMSGREQARLSRLVRRQGLLESRARRLDAQLAATVGAGGLFGGGPGMRVGGGGGGVGSWGSGGTRGLGGAALRARRRACSLMLLMPLGFFLLALSLLLVVSCALSCADRFFNGNYAQGFLLPGGASLFNPLDAALVFAANFVPLGDHLLIGLLMLFLVAATWRGVQALGVRALCLLRFPLRRWATTPQALLLAAANVLLALFCVPLLMFHLAPQYVLPPTSGWCWSHAVGAMMFLLASGSQLFTVAGSS